MSAPSQTAATLPEFLRPLQLSCYEYRGRVGRGMTQSHFASARTPAGRSVEIILKLREPGTTAGHFGGTSLATELIFAILARACGLNVPDYAIVDVGASFASLAYAPGISDLLSRNVGANFGSVRIQPSPMTWAPTHSSQSSALRDTLESVLSFDAAIINGDRSAANPNLLWDGRDTLHLIDHGLACPAHRGSQFSGNPLCPAQVVQEHSGFAYMLGTGAKYESLLERWNTVADAQFWRTLEASIPATWERQVGDLRAIFTFLVGRNPKFPEISDQLRRLVQ